MTKTIKDSNNIYLIIASVSLNILNTEYEQYISILQINVKSIYDASCAACTVTVDTRAN